MEVALILLALLLILSVGFNIFQQRKIGSMHSDRRTLEKLQEERLAEVAEEEKERMKTTLREKVSLEKKVKSLKVELERKREELGIDGLKMEIRDLNVQLAGKELELERRAMLYAAVKEGKVPISEDVARDLRDITDKLCRRSTDISYRKACKRLISDIDRGLEESVEYK